MKLIIFDIDGTLCHSRKVDDKSYINAFKKVLNIEIENTNWDTYKNVTDYYVTHDIIYNALNYKPDDSLINKVIDAYAEELMYRVQKDRNSYISIPGSNELVNYLLNNNNSYITGIATGGFNKTAKFKLGLLGFNFADETIFCSGEYRTKQEMINAFIIQEKTKGHILEKIIYIGDREYDYNVSKELNIDFIGIDFKGNGKLKSLGIEKVINNYEPIGKFLELL